MRSRNNYCRKLTANGYTGHEHPWIYVTEWPIYPVKCCYWNQQQTEMNWQLSARMRKIHLYEFPILTVIIWRSHFPFKIHLCVWKLCHVDWQIFACVSKKKYASVFRIVYKKSRFMWQVTILRGGEWNRRELCEVLWCSSRKLTAEEQTLLSNVTAPLAVCELCYIRAS